MGKINVLFLVNEEKDKDFAYSNKIIEYLSKKDASIFSDGSIPSHFKNVKEYNNEEICFAIVLGGDGTILNEAHKYKDLNLPFFGINIGRVGCLTDSKIDNCYDKLDEIFNNNYYIEKRNVINCEIFEGNNLVNEVVSFNEVAIHKSNLFKMLLFNVYINNHNKTSLYSDGILVATTTGSSAYNLSSGGPLLFPTSNNFVITPLSPQLRSLTSLVVNDNETITIDIDFDAIREDFIQYKPTIFVDGAYRFEMNKNSKIRITKSDKSLNIIKTNKEASLFEPIYKVSLSTNDTFDKNK